MAWTTPKTWTVGELVTAANLNLQIRDNLLVIGKHVKVAKALDATLANDNTLNDDPDLLFALGANETWVFEGVLLVSASATPGFQFGINGPLGVGGHWWYAASLVAFAAGNVSIGTGGVATNNAMSSEPFWFGGVVRNGGTAGNLQVRWSQATSSATSITVRADSYMWANQI